MRVSTSGNVTLPFPSPPCSCPPMRSFPSGLSPLGLAPSPHGSNSCLRNFPLKVAESGNVGNEAFATTARYEGFRTTLLLMLLSLFPLLLPSLCLLCGKAINQSSSRLKVSDGPKDSISRTI